MCAPVKFKSTVLTTHTSNGPVQMQKLDIGVPNEKHFLYSPGQKNPLSNNCKKEIQVGGSPATQLIELLQLSEALLLPVAQLIGHNQ